MLIKSEAELKTYANIRLLFDDDTSVEQLICTGTRLKVTYRHNDCKETKSGMVTDIQKIIYRDDTNAYRSTYDSCVHHHVRELRPEEQCTPRVFDRTCCSDKHTEDCAEAWFKPAKPHFIIVMDCSEDYNSDIVKIPDTDIVDIELLAASDRVNLLTEYNAGIAIKNIKDTGNSEEPIYTEESFSYLTNVLKLAKIVLDDPSIETSVCDTTYQILHAAILALELIPEDEETPSTGEGEDTPTETPSEENPINPDTSTEEESGTPTTDEEQDADLPEAPSIQMVTETFSDVTVNESNS